MISAARISANHANAKVCDEFGASFSKQKLYPWLRLFWQRQHFLVFIGAIIQCVQKNGITPSAKQTHCELMEAVSAFCSSNFQDDATVLVAALR